MDVLPDDKTYPELTFAALREEGIALLQRLAGHRWTDHNTHDPGITLLEQLCYTLTDLAYRTGFSIPDLMAEGKANHAWPDTFRSDLMLTTGPVTLNDWRKVILDTPGVQNAWVYPLDTTSEDYDARLYFDLVDNALQLSPAFQLRDSQLPVQALEMLGLYRVAFIPEPGTNPERTKNNIRERLNGWRNLCEDFHRIDYLTMKGVQLNAIIEIGDAGDHSDLMARIYYAVYDYISPRIRFYSLSERLAAGLRIEDLLEGPRLEQGFLDDDEIEAFQRRRSLRISDMIRLILEQKGVRSVPYLEISLPDTDKKASTHRATPWELVIPDNQFPLLILPPAKTLNDSPEPGVEFQKSGLTVRVDWNVTLSRISQLLDARNTRLAGGNYEVAPGRNRQVGQYQSIQHQFPELYGVGTRGLPASASPLRKAQALQFKAYLSIFDQLLANAFSQIGGVGAMYSTDEGSTGKTYFTQSLLREIPGLDTLIKADSLKNDGDGPPGDRYFQYLLDLMKKNESNYLGGRRDRLLDHLLSRFGEEFLPYDQKLSDEKFQFKEALLHNYPVLGRRRGAAFNYTRPPSDSNISGLEYRLSVLLGFDRKHGMKLSDMDEGASGGFYMIEHILLRPGKSDKGQKGSILKLPEYENSDAPPRTDPFSMQLSFIFPDWLVRFDQVFRVSIRKTLREETPAHLRIHIHWLKQVDMVAFEKDYEQWIQQMNVREV